MNHRHYAPSDARALRPLLDSIARELEERSTRLAEVEVRVKELRASPFFDERLHELEAEAATLRRELRHCREEVERLGCQVIATEPVTIRIPTAEGSAKKNLVWRPLHGTRA